MPNTRTVIMQALGLLSQTWCLNMYTICQ